MRTDLGFSSFAIDFQLKCLLCVFLGALPNSALSLILSRCFSLFSALLFLQISRQSQFNSKRSLPLSLSLSLPQSLPLSLSLSLPLSLFLSLSLSLSPPPSPLSLLSPPSSLLSLSPSLCLPPSLSLSVSVSVSVSVSFSVSVSVSVSWSWQGRAESEKGLSSPVPDQQRSSSCFPVCSVGFPAAHLSFVCLSHGGGRLRPSQVWQVQSKVVDSRLVSNSFQAAEDESWSFVDVLVSEQGQHSSTSGLTLPRPSNACTLSQFHKTKCEAVNVQHSQTNNPFHQKHQMSMFK